MTRKFASVLPVLAKMLRDADRVTAVSPAVADDVLEYEPSVAARLSVIVNGITPPVHDVSPVPKGPPRLLCMGRLDHQKGFDLAVAALARLRGTYQEARLVVAGDGPERDRLRELARELGVDDRIDFLGEVGPEDVGPLLDACRAVVMPSRFEGLPLVALEAAWAGRPIVAAESPGLADAVVPGETALTVPAEDADALAKGVAQLLADPERAGELGRRARAVAESRYSLDRCVDEYERLYHDVVDTRVC